MAPSAAYLQMVGVIGDIAESLIMTRKIAERVGRLVEHDDFYKGWAGLEEGICRKHAQLVAWCNDMRRRQVEDLEAFWSESQREDGENLTLMTLRTAEATDDIFDEVTGCKATPEERAPKTLLRWHCDNLKLFESLLEVWKLMGIMGRRIPDSHPNASRWEQPEDLSRLLPKNQFSVIWDMVEEAMKLLAKPENEPALAAWQSSHWTYVNFCNRKLLSSLDDSSDDPRLFNSLRESAAETFGQVLFYLAEAINDLLQTNALDRSHRDELILTLAKVESVLDMQILVSATALWADVRLEAFSPTTVKLIEPFNEVVAVIEALRKRSIAVAVVHKQIAVKRRTEMEAIARAEREKAWKSSILTDLTGFPQRPPLAVQYLVRSHAVRQLNEGKTDL